MTNPLYPATSLSDAVSLTIEDSNLLHDVINGDSVTSIEVDDGPIPALRKSITDNFYYIDPIDWNNGSPVTEFNQLVKFTDGTLWVAPTARTTNPILMGVTPVGDSLWAIAPVSPKSQFSADIHMTLAEAVADTTLLEGQALRITDRDSGIFNVVSGETANGANIIDHSTLPLQLSLEVGMLVKASNWSAFDGVNDDADNLQEMLEYCYNNEEGFIGAGVTAKLSKTLYIPNFPTTTKFVSLDFNGMNIIPNEDVNNVLESGKLSGGVWVTAMFDTLNANQTNLTEMKGFTVVRDAGNDNSAKTAVQLIDWHYGCEIKHLGARNFGTGFYLKNCFSSEIDMCQLWNVESITRAGKGFVLDTASNLITLKRCTSLNTAVGYELRGGLTAVAMVGCSFEGQVKGLVCTGQVFDLSVVDSYIEGVEDTVFNFDVRVESAVFENNYVNQSAHPASFLFDYLPAPSNNLIWRASNHLLGVTDSMMFKDVDTTVGYNSVTIEVKPRATQNIDQLLVDNDNFPKNLNYDSILQSTYKARVVNTYAEAQYAGRFSTGIDTQNGFEWIDNTSAVMEVRTKYTASATGRIYVALKVSATGNEVVRGELIGNCLNTGLMEFYEYTATGLEKSTKLTVSLVSGFFHLHYTAGNVVTNVRGEVRLT